MDDRVRDGPSDTTGLFGVHSETIPEDQIKKNPRVKSGVLFYSI
jgi:hypothetical protein